MQNKSSCSRLGKKWVLKLQLKVWWEQMSHICNHEPNYAFVRDTEIGYYAKIADQAGERVCILSLELAALKSKGSSRNTCQKALYLKLPTVFIIFALSLSFW